MQTSELFTLGFLIRHPTTMPIIKKYFGRSWFLSHDIRSNYHINDNKYAVWGKNSCLQLAMELDNIPACSLLPKSFIEDFERFFKSNSHLKASDDYFGAVSEYMLDRPYSAMLRDDERQFANLLLMLYIIKKYNIGWSKIREQYYSSSDWQNAMIYLRHRNKRLFNISDSKLERGKNALINYQARYVVNYLSVEQLEKMLDDFFDLEKFVEHSGKFFKIVNQYVGEDIQEKFIRQLEPRVIDIDGIDFDELYCYPEWIDFTPAARREIIKLILQDELSDEQINYYLDTSERREHYTELYPAIKHVLQITDNSHTFYTAGNVLNVIWENLPEEDDALQEWFRKEIYDIFWPRIGSVWPIAYHDMFSLEGDTEEIFKNALGWVMCLDDVDTRNLELGAYLKSDAETNFEEIRKRRFDIVHKGENIEKRLTAVFKELPSAAWGYCYYPHTTEEADYILEKVAEDSSYSLRDVLEMMLITGNLKGVGSHILKNLAENFKLWSERLSPYSGDSIDAMLSIFTAACSGATEDNELKPLRLLGRKIELQAKKAIEVTVDNYDDVKKEITKALELANRGVADYREQCEDLRKNLRRHTKEIEQAKTNLNFSKRS